MKQLFWGDSGVVDLVAHQLKSGNVVLAEGDTVLGLLADLSIEGRAELDRIKSRSNKPYIVLVADSKKALNFIAEKSNNIFQIEKIINNFWPGPLTLIVKAGGKVPDGICSINGAIALRVPQHPGLLELLKRFDGIFSTSANLSGGAIPEHVNDVDPAVIQEVSCVVLNDQGYHAQSVPSTIIDCTGEEIVVVREGAVTMDQLKPLL